MTSKEWEDLKYGDQIKYNIDGGWGGCNDTNTPDDILTVLRVDEFETGKYQDQKWYSMTIKGKCRNNCIGHPTYDSNLEKFILVYKMPPEVIENFNFSRLSLIE